MADREVLTRTGLTAAGAAGVVLVLLSTVLTIIRIRVGTVVELDGYDTAFSGWERHGPAPLLLGLLAVPMLLGALRGARPAAAAVLALGLVVLAITLVQDVPDAGETGSIGTAYADARAEAGPGFWAELAGGLLLAGTGGALLALGRGPRRGRGRDQQRADRPPREP